MSDDNKQLPVGKIVFQQRFDPPINVRSGETITEAFQMRYKELKKEMEDLTELKKRQEANISELNARLDEEKAKLSTALDTIAELKRAIIWMSGSPDFAEGGKAHQGWLEVRSLVYPEEGKK